MLFLKNAVYERSNYQKCSQKKQKLHFFLAVLADSLNALSVGAPLLPGLRIFSPDPALMRACLAWMLL
jgi:hypothetical protein